LLPIALNLLKTLELTLSLNQNRSDRGMQNKFKKIPRFSSRDLCMKDRLLLPFLLVISDEKRRLFLRGLS
ncbi:MAG: hypothetical protein MK214_17880, partial [Thalassotalea sp.]|nr:hypothetical protein [Thalassotalea sp.]